MIDVEQYKPAIKTIAEKHDLMFVILFGSQSTGRATPNSDIDIAVLGRQPISMNVLVALNDAFSQTFKFPEMDVKSLYRTTALFRYQVTLHGILLYGSPLEYCRYQDYAFKCYHDSKDLFQLRDQITRKRLQHLRAKII